MNKKRMENNTVLPIEVNTTTLKLRFRSFNIRNRNSVHIKVNNIEKALLAKSFLLKLNQNLLYQTLTLGPLIEAYTK